jgi:hypothetical protein
MNLNPIQRVSVVRVDGGPYNGKYKIAAGSSVISVTEDEAIAIIRLFPRDIIKKAGLLYKGEKKEESGKVEASTDVKVPTGFKAAGVEEGGKACDPPSPPNV